MTAQKQIAALKIGLAIAVIANIVFWFNSKSVRTQWLNVPPVPTQISAVTPALGDTQFASRLISMMIQNLGSTGGRITPVKDYDFEKLGGWFMLNYELDTISNSTPYIAAFYYGASQDRTKIKPVIDYLRVVGNNPEGEKWRWLAHAVYLARFRYNDLELAMELADDLKNLQNGDMPEWTRRMQVNILNQRGDKQAALELMLSILKDRADRLHPNEVNAMVAYICEQILDPAEAKTHSLCQNN